MLTLIVIGEVVFFLPFVLPRIFRPTLLEVFGLTNFELGLAFSVYGTIAVLAYLPGGPLADWFSARKLMTLSCQRPSASVVAWVSMLTRMCGSSPEPEPQ